MLAHGCAYSFNQILDVKPLADWHLLAGTVSVLHSMLIVLLQIQLLNVQVDHATAAAAWRQIKQKMQPPKCPGHNENCVIREVKKPGPNKGKITLHISALYLA